MTLKTLALTLALIIGAPLIASDKATEALMRETQCFACHAVNKKVVGPSYQAVARKYRGKPGAVAKLCATVRDGGYGVWGPIHMPSHPQLTATQIKAMVLWIMKRK